MLTHLEAYNARNDFITLPITDGSGSLRILNIDGLGPVTATVTSTQYGMLDGEYFQNVTVGKRNIVLTIGSKPDWITETVESLRQKLYAYFMPKSTVNLRFFSTTMETVEISGKVESLEPNLFTKDPEIQISIINTDPYFNGLAETVITGFTIEASPTDATYTNVNYLGNVPSGFIFQVKANSAVPETDGLMVLRTKAIDEESVQIVATVNNVMFIEISTIPGYKYVHQRGVISDYQNITGNVTYSDWPQLQPGANQVAFQTYPAGQNWSMSYFNRYGGL